MPVMRASRDMRLYLSLTAAMVLAACSGAAPNAANSSAKAADNGGKVAHNAAVANSAAPAPSPGPQTIASKEDGLEFSYQWPAEAAAIPALHNWLRGNGEKIRKENQSAAIEAKADAKKNDYPFHGYSYEEGYATVANTSRMLVLLSDGYVYTGGAHGMPVTTAIVWDKAGQKRVGTGALIDIPRFAALAKQRFCAELDAQRAEKRGEPVRHDDPNELDDFVQCVDMTKQLILPLSKGGRTLDTVRVVISPYEAGPYAEGSYIIDLPMDSTLIAAVRPDYRGAFGGGR